MDNSAANFNQSIPQPINPQAPPPAPPVDPGSVYGGGQGSKKKLIAIIGGIILLVLIVVVAFFALRNPGESTGNAEITYWGLWEDEAVFNEIIQDFEAQNPHIKVKYEKRSDIKEAPGGGYIPFLKTRIESGTGPDIFRYHTSWLYPLRNHLAVLPEDVLKEINLKDNYFPVVSNDMTLSNAVYGVPLGYDALVMYVNNELVTDQGYDIPQDWSMLLDTARDITKPDEVTGEILIAGASMGTYDNVDHAADIISLLAIQRGIVWAELAGLSGGTEEERASKQEAAKTKMKDILEFYTCFAVSSDICTPVWSSDMPSSKLAFVQGKVAFYIGYSWDLLEIMNANPDNKSFSVHPVPKLSSDSNGAATLAGYWVEGVSDRSKVKPQAFMFLQFLSKRENLEKLYKAQVSQRSIGVVYPRKDLANMLIDDPMLAPVVSQGSNSRSSLFYSDTFGGGEAESLENYLADAVSKIIRPQQRVSSATAVDEFTEGIRSILLKYAQQNAQQNQ